MSTLLQQKTIQLSDERTEFSLKKMKNSMMIDFPDPYCLPEACLQIFCFYFLLTEVYKVFIGTPPPPPPRLVVFVWEHVSNMSSRRRRALLLDVLRTSLIDSRFVTSVMQSRCQPAVTSVSLHYLLTTRQTCHSGLSMSQAFDFTSNTTGFGQVSITVWSDCYCEHRPARWMDRTLQDVAILPNKWMEIRMLPHPVIWWKNRSTHHQFWSG